MKFIDKTTRDFIRTPVTVISKLLNWLAPLKGCKLRWSDWSGRKFSLPIGQKLRTKLCAISTIQSMNRTCVPALFFPVYNSTNQTSKICVS